MASIEEHDSWEMNALLRKAATALPETWRSYFRRRFGWRWFRGSYSSWTEAREASAGYDDAAILTRVLAATRKVRAGLASWERDGWAFDSPELNMPLVSALRSAAEEFGGKLDVVDFGGSLGSTWWQHRAVVGEMSAARWCVVEQSHYVAGGAEFSNAVLTFHESIDGALETAEPMFILFSSVLSYLQDPGEILAAATDRGFRHIVIDRTPIAIDGRDRLVVQHTPPELGGGSYPAWLFSRDRLLDWLGPLYRLKTEWLGFEELDRRVQYTGFHFERIEQSIGTRG